jgi:excinuclease ABC subunit C
MKDRLKNVPLQPGVYLYKDKEGRGIYVGKARVLRNRLRSYFQAPAGLHPKVRAMMARVAEFDYIVTSTEVEALILENNLIESYMPRYNIDLRDDKSYPYLKITAEKFPRVCYRTREKRSDFALFWALHGCGLLAGNHSAHHRHLPAAYLQEHEEQPAGLSEL